MKNKLIIVLVVLLLDSCVSTKDEEPFIKDYKLLKLDNKACDDCLLRVNKGHVYYILVNGKKIDEGSWTLKNPLDVPGFSLELENGPRYIILKSDSVIEYIDRPGTVYPHVRQIKMD